MDTDKKLSSLRQVLAAQNLDGFIVPRTDEFQGEYVPAGAERLAWLTGFTGSAGFAIVTQDKAAVMSDGRYTEQLAMEVDPTLFATADSTKTSASAWLAENAAGQRIGYDPRLHTVRDLATLETALAGHGGVLQAIEGDNPVDALWTDRPAAPASAVAIFPSAIAGRDAADKIADIAQTVAKAGGFAVVIALPESIAWLLNIRGDDVPHTPVALSYAAVRADGQVDWFIEPSRLDAEVRRHIGNRVAVHAPAALDAQLAALAGAAKEKGQAVLFDEGRTPVRFRNRLTDAGAKTAHLEDPCIVPRARKTAAEQAGIRAAHLRDGVAVVRCLHWLDAEAPKGTLTELEVVAQLQAFRAEAPDYRDDSFDTIAGWGAHGAIVHYRATEKTNIRIAPPGLLLLDSGGQYVDGTTDITRTIAIGPPSAEMRENFTRVLKGHIAIATARFPDGTPGAQLDGFARRALWEAGRDYDHGTGHGVGCYLSVHEEAASLSKRPGRGIMAGMLISNEPGFYKAGEYGIRIENLVLAREDGMREGSDVKMLAFDTVTLAPIDRRAIDAALLDESERAWLNAYHARVHAALAPLLEPAVAEWLRQATAAIS